MTAVEFPDYEAIEEQFGALADESLSPRGPEDLYNYVADLGLAPGTRVLDVGCNHGAHAIELRRRFGFKVTGIDPSPSALVLARRAAEAFGVAGEVDFKSGRIEAIPAEPGSIDFVWCRDTIELVADLEQAFGEVSRVLRPGGRMLIYTMCATDLLSAEEAVLVIENLGVVTQSMQVAYIEGSFKKAGLEIERCDVLGPEWGEYSQEQAGKPGQRLLRVARLLRQPDHYIDRFGRKNYDVAVADYLWHVYRMIGKLSSRVYLLSLTGS